MIYANFCSGGEGIIHLVFDIKDINKITTVVRLESTSPTTFYGSVDAGLVKETITTTDGEELNVWIDTGFNINNCTLLGKCTINGYKYEKLTLDVSMYNYLHIYHSNSNYRDWIHLFECE